MKKTLIIGLMLVSCLLFACKENTYVLESGIYELDQATLTGDFKNGDFAYYSIELYADGTFLIKSQGQSDSDHYHVAYQSSGTFEITNGNIVFISHYQDKEFKEEGTYEKDKITLDLTIKDDTKEVKFIGTFVKV